MISLPVCKWRSQNLLAHGNYVCSSPKVITNARVGVHPMLCARCELADLDVHEHPRPPIKTVQVELPEPPEPRAIDQPVEQPGLLQKAKNFAGAVVQHVAGGMKNVDNETYRIRLEVCAKCPHFMGGMTCAVCGCNMNIKARWADQDCPQKRWPPRQEAKP